MDGSSDIRRSGFRATVLLYALALAVLVVILKYVEYRFLIRDLSVEVYIGVVAVLFTALGIWVGSKLLARKAAVVQASAPAHSNGEASRLAAMPSAGGPVQAGPLGISARELEVLRLMAQGHPNQGIADKLFISLPTVKSHSSSLFGKLEVKSRTQAVLKAKEVGIIP